MAFRFKNLGPGVLVAAAFIGPGTVTVCTVAGVRFGYSLLWALAIATLATVLLQEMAARLGLVAQKGLAKAVREQIQSRTFRILAVALILTAIVLGNAAYEAGNISGGILGLQALDLGYPMQWNDYTINLWPLLLGGLAFVLLWQGSYRLLERFLVALVLLMSASFILSAILTAPALSILIQNLLVPTAPEDSLLTIIALVGTTVVPYNLFLHASLVQEKWKGVKELAFAKADTYIAVILGGLVSMCILIAAAAIDRTEVQSALDLAEALVPLYGTYAKYCIAIGLFAAGLTSAITAPLAAAYVAQGCLGWEQGLKTKGFRAIWMLILISGTLGAVSGIKPLFIIQIAQVANGVLLPVIAGFLLWIVNRKQLMGSYTNGWLGNILGIILVLATLVLGMRSIFKVLGIL
ncbi:Nramp family divalent metal transporter [Croceiramulus getboli]|nr:Nramp family divalent metal transporter [Flavobacteriaceae bacterium YJPT1-3]